MKGKVEIKYGQYTDIEYRMFEKSSTIEKLMEIAGWLTLPFIYPLVLLAKLSPETGFRTVSEFLSIIPFAIGAIIRYEFYCRTLRSCGYNVFISFFWDRFLLSRCFYWK